MAPPGLDAPAPLESVAAGLQLLQPGEEGQWLPGSELKENVSKKVPSEPSVQAYEDATQVPSEFVVKNLARLPSRSWGDANYNESQLGSHDFELPVIDISPLMIVNGEQRRPVDEEGATKTTAKIGKACEEWGLFQVINHGIPEDLLERLVEVAHEFFRMPPEDKQVYAVKPGEIEGYGRVDYDELSRYWNDCLRHTIRPKPIVGQDGTPNKPPAYRGLIEEYAQGVEKILQVLWKSLSEYLGLESTILEKAQEDDSRLVIRVNYYPKCSEPEKVLGIADHKDFGTLTVLVQDEVGGLQVQKPGTDVWVDVKPKKGSLVINIANQVEILSNGRYTSALHRALVNRNRPRVSIGAFATPGPNCIIRPLPELLEITNQGPRYKQLLYGDYIPNFRADSKAGLCPHARYKINKT